MSILDFNAMTQKLAQYGLLLIVTTLGHADSNEATKKEDIKAKLLFEGKEFYDQRLQKMIQSKKESSSRELKKQETNTTESFKLYNTGKKE